MSLSIFDEKEFVPNTEMLSVVLLESKTIWDFILSHITNTYKGVICEWKYYSKSAGWTLVIKSEKRTLIYLIPLKGYFKANFVFGDNAVGKCQNIDLPEPILTSIIEAKKHIEGRSFMVDIKSSQDAKIVEKLLDIKNDN